ncbi:glycosyltransferase involved in cell wall biosynthesis [Dokdonella fugitiva]|uniref:Glycosyltransferase involved in cell wall biosynthesis n=1 Tax=Dokdonella fugitiva TaxID=328517 RepID=A0A839F3L1_9GAMM|nr:glycosyltransferase [Dokdonella fugitiva]MBA8889633.1 glycosyltransferase involved in cell wall biosynthesis [Dokdonella fugitiva]
MAERRLTVVQLLPAFEAGGAERSALEVARALVEAGHRSIIVSAGGRMVERAEREGSEHVTLPIGAKSLRALAQVPKLRALLRQVGADIVHARSRMPAWVGWLAVRGLKPRPHFVTTAHGLNSPGIYSSVMARGERVICVSNTVRDYLLRNYPRTDPNKLVVIPRGIDPSDYPFGYLADNSWREWFFAEFPQLAGAPLLTLPGRGTRLKGHADAIELVSDLKARGIPTRLLLLGARQEGREAYVAELERLAVERGIADQLAISAQRDDTRDVFAASALVLQLSNKPESFGRTVVEALALCRPVLGYDHGGVGELLADLYPAGRVPPQDRERLTERAAELLRAAPPITPLQRYRLADMQAATLALYREIVGAG